MAIATKLKLKIGLLQMQSIDHLDANLDFIMTNLELAAQQGVEVVFTPENALYMRMKEGEAIEGISIENSEIQKLQKVCSQLGISIHLGSLPLRCKDKLTNSSIFINQNGCVFTTYQKVHLFDIQLQGQRPIKESDVFEAGDSPKVLTFSGWSLGQTICYDIRFSNLFLKYALFPVDCILVPSAFLVRTGEAHWHSLLRARAIESQCYVIAPAQAGNHIGLRGNRETYGHSIVVSPWGEVLIDAKKQLGLFVCELDRNLIDQVRMQIPMQRHRKLIDKETMLIEV